MTGCVDYTGLIEESENGPKVDGDVITLRISRPGDRQMQKAPIGGQYGYGFQKGNQWSDYLKDVNYDYDLQNLCLFVYESDRDDAMNGSPATEFLYKVYIPHDKLQVHFDRTNDTHDDHDIDAYYTSAKIALDGFRKRGYHHIAAVGNVGDITGSVNNLGQLRDYIVDKPSFDHSGATTHVYANCAGDAATHHVLAAGGDYSNFAMGLYEEPTWLDNKSNGSDETPHIAVITLERLAARIDVKLNQFPSVASQKADPRAPIPYDVEAGGDVLSRNWLTHVRFVNAKQKSSYLMRRTANNPKASSTGGFVKYLGFETDQNGITTNYVVTPNTSSPLVSYFGPTALSSTRMNEFEETERVISRKAFAPYTSDDYVGKESALAFSNTDDNYFIVGYAEENTLPTDRMTRDYTTGLLFRSIYEPATVYRLNAAGDDFEGETESLTTDVCSNGKTPSGGDPGAHYGKTFWMIERLVPNPTEADRAYFVADAAGDQDADGNTTDAGKVKIKKAVQLFINAHDHDGHAHDDTGWTQPIEYVGGIAYNYYWIRHSNSQGTGHPFTPMEYSIVRNNIYSVSITSFSGPGAPSTDPSMDNPDRILPITYVHKWHPYTVEEVGM